jgi:hypothetical protein
MSRRRNKFVLHEHVFDDVSGTTIIAPNSHEYDKANFDSHSFKALMSSQKSLFSPRRN